MKKNISILVIVVTGFIMGVFYINATSLSQFPTDGIKMSAIVAGAYPEIPCEQVISLTENGFTSVGANRSNTQISSIVAVNDKTLRIQFHNSVTGATGFQDMNFLMGSVAGGWGGESSLAGIITSVETLSPTSGDLLPADGLKITGQKLNSNGSVNSSNVVGYIFFTGNVKMSTSVGVQSAGTGLNTFYAQTITGVPFGRSIFVGTNPVASGTERTALFPFKCYNLAPKVETNMAGTLQIITNFLINQE